MNRLKKQLINALKSHLNSGKTPKVPVAGVALWNIFTALSTSRTYHSNGANPIAYSEIKRYCDLYNWPLQPHHIDIIKSLDETYLEHTYNEIKTGSKGANKKIAGNLDAATFDAFF